MSELGEIPHDADDEVEWPHVARSPDERRVIVSDSRLFCSS